MILQLMCMFLKRGWNHFISKAVFRHDLPEKSGEWGLQFTQTDIFLPVFYVFDTRYLFCFCFVFSFVTSKKPHQPPARIILTSNSPDFLQTWYWEASRRTFTETAEQLTLENTEDLRSSVHVCKRLKHLVSKRMSLMAGVVTDSWRCYVNLSALPTDWS